MDMTRLRKIRIQETLPLLLKSKRITLRGLARRTGISVSTLAGWISENSNPSNLKQVSIVADALEVSLDYLVYGEREIELDLKQTRGDVILDGIYRLRLERLDTKSRK